MLNKIYFETTFATGHSFNEFIKFKLIISNGSNNDYNRSYIINLMIIL